MINVLLERASLEKRIGAVLALFLLIIALGAAGYVVLENWSWLDAFYMAIITVTTVGFAEVHPLSQTGKVFTLALIVLGVGAFTFTFGTITDYLVTGRFRGFLMERLMKRETQKLQSHFIVCGYGQVGEEVLKEFSRERQSMVVIDPDEKAIENAQALNHCLAIQGDAGDDDVLRAAGIERARGLIAAADSDATNVLIALSARAINPRLFIIARANSEDNRSKLIRAGADRVISPAIIGGRSMAQMAIRPHVVEFLDVVTRDENMAFWIEDLVVGRGSDLDGMAIGNKTIYETTGGVTILTIQRHDDQAILSPTPETRLFAGDTVMVFGKREHLRKFQHMAQPGAASA